MKDKELQLQRLVDGQLNRQEIQVFLGHAQDHPGLWREIASTFVEDQIWRTEIQTAENIGNANGGIGATELARQAKLDTEGDQTRSAERMDQSRRFSGIKFWVSLAAATLLGLWLGNSWDEGSNETNPDNRMVKDNTADSVPSLDGIANQGLANPDTQLADSGTQQRLFKPVHHLSMGEAGDIPLYTIDEARKLGMTFDDSKLPEETVAKYQEQGYQLQQNTQYISGSTNDGRRVLVPIRLVTLNPGN